MCIGESSSISTAYERFNQLSEQRVIHFQANRTAPLISILNSAFRPGATRKDLHGRGPAADEPRKAIHTRSTHYPSIHQAQLESAGSEEEPQPSFMIVPMNRWRDIHTMTPPPLLSTLKESSTPP